MKYFVPSIEISEDTGFSRELDIFKRKSFGEELLNIILNCGDELVIAFDAPWGEGKSTFFQMWRGLLKEKQVAHIYFDAFDNDYQTDPFIALASQIYSLIEDDNSQTNFTKKALSAMKAIGRASVRFGIKTLTAGVLDNTVIDDLGNTKDAAKETSSLVDSYIENLLSKSDENKEYINSFKEHLSKLALEIGNGKPIVIIIDELDRCKPKYALSLIESIKHLFSVPNVTFVLVMNRTQLEASVKCEYGNNVNASQYLQKFISLWSTFPKPRDVNVSLQKQYLHECLRRMEYASESAIHKSTIKLYEELVVHFRLSLREIEKSLTNYAIIFNATDGKLSAHYSFLSVFIAILKVVKPLVYRELLNNSITQSDLHIEIEFSSLELDRIGNSYLQMLDILLRYYLGSEDEAKRIRESVEFQKFELIEVNRRALDDICRFLESFKHE